MCSAASHLKFNIKGYIHLKSMHGQGSKAVCEVRSENSESVQKADCDNNDEDDNDDDDDDSGELRQMTQNSRMTVRCAAPKSCCRNLQLSFYLGLKEKLKLT